MVHMANNELLAALHAPMAAILCVAVEFLDDDDDVENATRIWMKPWLKRRDEEDGHSLVHLYQELFNDGETNLLMRTLRMPPTVFEELLDLVGPRITKQNTNWRKAITPEIRLCLTLRFLCLGDGFVSLHQQFWVGLTTTAGIVYETCRALYDVLQPLVMKVPKTKQGWLQIAQLYEERWNMPHCIGAVDGKHVRIRKPVGSESRFHNYKNFFSIVLMAVVDANYSFLYIDVGAEGSACDGGIWDSCGFKRKLVAQRNSMSIPPPANHAGLDDKLSYFLVGDDAFPLSTRLMKPFPGQGLTGKQRIFNYRLSRARRIVENAFGILSAKFAIYSRDLRMKPERAVHVVKATCVLHNFMRSRCGREYMAPNMVDHEDSDHVLHAGGWRQVAQVDGLQRMTRRNSYAAAKQMRNNLADYFVRAGAVDWQYDQVAL